jgi:hypothetical protein
MNNRTNQNDDPLVLVLLTGPPGLVIGHLVEGEGWDGKKQLLFANTRMRTSMLINNPFGVIVGKPEFKDKDKKEMVTTTSLRHIMPAPIKVIEILSGQAIWISPVTDDGMINLYNQFMTNSTPGKIIARKPSIIKP